MASGGTEKNSFFTNGENSKTLCDLIFVPALLCSFLTLNNCIHSSKNRNLFLKIHNYFFLKFTFNLQCESGEHERARLHVKKVHWYLYICIIYNIYIYIYKGSRPESNRNSINDMTSTVLLLIIIYFIYLWYVSG